MELADIEDLKSSGNNTVWVQVPYPAPKNNTFPLNFKRKCKHPQKFIDTVWRYIPGECVKEPDYDRCMLCGQIVV